MLCLPCTVFIRVFLLNNCRNFLPKLLELIKCKGLLLEPVTNHQAVLDRIRVNVGALISHNLMDGWYTQLLPLQNVPDPFGRPRFFFLRLRWPDKLS